MMINMNTIVVRFNIIIRNCLPIITLHIRKLENIFFCFAPYQLYWTATSFENNCRISRMHVILRFSLTTRRNFLIYNINILNYYITLQLYHIIINDIEREREEGKNRQKKQKNKQDKEIDMLSTLYNCVNVSSCRVS